jgi:hypothetical protein
MKRIIFCLFSLAIIGLSKNLMAQAGMTVSPGKLYYQLAAGGNSTQKIIVSNPNSRDLEIGLSLNDWDYDSLGNNQTFDAGALKTSAADWVRVMPGSYFTLKPGEKRELDVILRVPANVSSEIPVHTAMLFLTQLNPGFGRAADGTSIKVSVRMGIKIYHSFNQYDERNIEVINFTDVLPNKEDKTTGGYLELKLNNTGKQWLEGKIKWEVLNTQTGEKKKLEEKEIFSLPGDQRLVRQNLPPNMAKGKYTATSVINYGDKDELKLVELEFER